MRSIRNKNTPCGQNVELLYIKPGCTKRNSKVLKHGCSNCGKHITIGTPTVVDRYVALITTIKMQVIIISKYRNFKTHIKRKSRTFSNKELAT